MTITLELTPNAVSNLSMMRKKLGLQSDIDVIRNALATLHLLLEIHEDGTVLFLRYKDGTEELFPITSIIGEVKP